MKCKEFRLQIQKDCEFLCKNNIIDYSLLVGIHVKKFGNDEISLEEYANLAKGKSVIYENGANLMTLVRIYLKLFFFMKTLFIRHSMIIELFIHLTNQLFII